MGNIVGGIVGGLLGKSSGKKQSEAILQGGQQAAAQFQPFIQPGVTANNSILAALGVGGDTAAQDQAFQNYLGSTGFRARLKAGTDAIVGSNAARGLLNSGATGVRLQELGQNLASTGFDNYLGQLSGVAGRGAGAAAGAASALTGSATNAANARAGGDASFQSGIGQAVQGGFSLLGL